MSLDRQIRRYLPALTALVLMAAAAVGVGFYVLAHQRVHFPWQQRYAIRIELANAQAITPGQGQTIDVAGVAVGGITDVRLEHGVAVVTGQIDPAKLPRVYANATALVRPKTGLQDMVVALNPGTPRARALPDGGTIPVSHTRPQVSLDEVLAGLDADTRDYLRTLVGAGAQGLAGRGDQLRRLFKAAAPTLRLTRRVTGAIADRRRRVRRLVGNLRLLTHATAGKDRELAQLVSASAATFRAIDAQQASLRTGLSALPGTVTAARRALAAAQPFSERLGPTLTRLLPATRRLTPAMTSARPLLREATPALGDLLAFVRAARPVARHLRPTTANLLADTPDLTRSFAVLRYVVDELAYNPPGSQEGYLFWLAWFAHNSSSLLTEGDAHGLFWRGQAIFSCSTLATLGQATGGAGTVLAGLGDLLPCPKPPARAGVR
jgi:phospholipid/cholesterol/gamma-HCH transport system substrate-binding protein